MFCKFCGKETVGRFIYCPFCGKNQNEVVESIPQDEDSKSTKVDIKVESQNIERSENKVSKASDTNAIANVIYVSKEPKFQYALALIIMSIVLLIWRIDFILSIPVLLVVVLLSDVLLKLVSLF